MTLKNVKHAKRDCNRSIFSFLEFMLEKSVTDIETPQLARTMTDTREPEIPFMLTCERVCASKPKERRVFKRGHPWRCVCMCVPTTAPKNGPPAQVIPWQFTVLGRD
ncbi:uncharacterized protein LOC143256811 isoform X1 [Tachypleus tridentatus]|uniref:uncharacterized protein LOC143256811 isoform X1 n=1 Tax=Tachypleus tridentatus TaxID=6853 RepID=UPI003FD54A4C